MPKQRRTPWDVRLSTDERQQLGHWLSVELDKALAVRSASEGEVAYWHTLYEQGRTRTQQNVPWADAADLTSPIATEKVDALRSRIVKTIFVEPIWTVEGWGEAGKKAPFVEEFHQWQAEASGFQVAAAMAIHLSLIEPRGVLEIYEDQIRRPIRRTIQAAAVVSPETGAIQLDADMEPILQQHPDGSYVEVTESGDDTQPPPPSVEMVIDDYELVARGPRERAIPYRDFLVLPGHARNQTEIWGYGKRFWRRVDQLLDAAKQGMYDTAVIEDLGEGDERLGSSYTNAGATRLTGEAKEVVSQEEGLAEKELWEVTFLISLDKTGYRWFVATLHKESQTLLRLQYDDVGHPRYFSFVPFPRPDTTDGYSFVGHKLITTIEENTAWRNLLADRASLQLQAPLLRMQNSLWDPEEEPIGPRAVLTVRDPREIQALQIPDYTSPARERIIDTERQAEKLGGMTDVASGNRPNENRTLGETRLVTAFSEVRIEEVIRNIQETMEEIGLVRHIMWKRALSEMPQGMELPTTVVTGLETRGADVSTFLPNQRMVAAVMEGAFRFKPRGSVESTDKHQQRGDFAALVQGLKEMAEAIPTVALLLQQPRVVKALMEQMVRLYNIPDKQAFLGQETFGAVLAQQQQMQEQQAMQNMLMQSLPPELGGGASGPGGSLGSPGVGPGANPPSGPINPGRQLPQERVGVQ